MRDLFTNLWFWRLIFLLWPLRIFLPSLSEALIVQHLFQAARHMVESCGAVRLADWGLQSIPDADFQSKPPQNREEVSFENQGLKVEAYLLF